MSKSITVITFPRLVENLLSLAMTETDCAGLPLLAVRFPDTAITEKHWKSSGAVPMEHTMPVPNYTGRAAVSVLIWDITVSLHTRWNRRAVLLSEHRDSILMDKLVGNNGLVIDVVITISVRER